MVLLHTCVYIYNVHVRTCRLFTCTASVYRRTGFDCEYLLNVN